MKRRVYLDTCCVIYLLEDVLGFSAQMRRFLVLNPEAILCVSPLVRLEALVKPLSDGNQVLAKDYEDFLKEQVWLSLDDEVFESATQLRVAHRLKTPDALHIATAHRHGCVEFWTNDNRLQDLSLDINIIVIPKG
jgi:predicted nucleic acid-binding protein